MLADLSLTRGRRTIPQKWGITVLRTADRGRWGPSPTPFDGLPISAD